jgi:hypothetical protein
MNRTLNLIEHKNGRPPMMVDGFFVVWLQNYVEHTKALVLEEDLWCFGAAITASNAGSQEDGSVIMLSFRMFRILGV